MLLFKTAPNTNSPGRGADVMLAKRRLSAPGIPPQRGAAGQSTVKVFIPGCALEKRLPTSGKCLSLRLAASSPRPTTRASAAQQHAPAKPIYPEYPTVFTWLVVECPEAAVFEICVQWLPYSRRSTLPAWRSLRSPTRVRRTT